MALQLGLQVKRQIRLETYIIDLPLRRALARACCSLTEKPQASAKYVLGLPYLCRMCCRVACITCAGACENF